MLVCEYVSWLHKFYKFNLSCDNVWTLFKVAKLLINQGADLEAKNSAFKNPINLAKSPEMKKLLQEAYKAWRKLLKNSSAKVGPSSPFYAIVQSMVCVFFLGLFWKTGLFFWEPPWVTLFLGHRNIWNKNHFLISCKSKILTLDKHLLHISPIKMLDFLATSLINLLETYLADA